MNTKYIIPLFYFILITCGFNIGTSQLCSFPNNLFGPGQIHAKPESGYSVYKYLQNNGVLSDYMKPIMSEITRDIISHCDHWNDFQINQRFSPEKINVYILEHNKISNNTDSKYFSVSNNAMADHSNQIIFIDDSLIKELVIFSFLVANFNYSSYQAVGEIHLNGIDAYGKLFNTFMDYTPQTEDAQIKRVIVFRGMIAFIIAHEMGHLIGDSGDKRDDIRIPILLKEKEHLQYGCEKYIDPAHKIILENEKQADDFACNLLVKCTYPRNMYLAYEIGIGWFFQYLMGKDNIDACNIYINLRKYSSLESEKRIYASLRYTLPNDLAQKLTKQIVNESNHETQSSKPQTYMFFRKSHPSSLDRLFNSLTVFTSSPKSRFYGESNKVDIYMYNLLKERICDEIQ